MMPDVVRTYSSLLVRAQAFSHPLASEALTRETYEACDLPVRLSEPFIRRPFVRKAP